MSPQFQKIHIPPLVLSIRTDFHDTSASKVFECLVSDRHGQFIECSGVLPTTQFGYRQGLGTCNDFLCVLKAKCVGEWAL